MTGKKRALVVAALVAAVGALSYLALYRLSGGATPEGPTIDAEDGTIGGRIVYAEGAVEWLNADVEGANWERAFEGTDLNEGDSVETLGDSRAIVSLDDGSVLRLDSDTRLTFVSLDPSRIVVANEGGALYSRVARMKRSFEVLAGDVTYESLGTAYLTRNTDGMKGVEVYESKVRVKGGSVELAVVDEGEEYFLLNVDDPNGEGSVSEIPEGHVDGDKFLKWNKEEDEVWFKDSLGYLKGIGDEDASVESIELTHSGGGRMEWSAVGDSEFGFKLLWSREPGATYPTREGDQYRFYGDPGATFGYVHAFDGSGSYHVRVCEYLDGECGTYSNEVEVDLETPDTDFGSAKAVPDGEEYEAPGSKEGAGSSSGGVSSIQLTSDGGGNVSWDWIGSSPNGWKVVWSLDSGPTYPTRSGDRYLYYDDPGRRTASVNAFAGSGTYHVRVCEYLGGLCGAYSNEVTVQLQGEEKKTDKQSSGVSSIDLAVGSGSTVSWTAYGFAENGFKVVWSKSSGPTYPTRSGDKYEYYSSGYETSSSVWPFDGSGTYYVRVCEYLGGACGVYSNEVSIGL